MNNIDIFNNIVRPKIPLKYSLAWYDFYNGEFGDLKRLEFESPNKIGTIDFWLTGWIAMDVFDTDREEQVFNILCSVDQESDIKSAFDTLLKIMSDD